MSHVTPDTTRKALERIIEGIRSGAIAEPAGCQYLNENTGKPCIIGYLLGPELCKEIVALPGTKDIGSAANGTGISEIESMLPNGEARLPAAMGITVPQATVLQTVWDSGGTLKPEHLVSELQDILKHGAGRIGSEYFFLKKLELEAA